MWLNHCYINLLFIYSSYCRNRNPWIWTSHSSSALRIWGLTPLNASRMQRSGIRRHRFGTKWQCVYRPTLSSHQRPVNRNCPSLKRTQKKKLDVTCSIWRTITAHHRWCSRLWWTVSYYYYCYDNNGYYII